MSLSHIAAKTIRPTVVVHGLGRVEHVGVLVERDGADRLPAGTGVSGR